MIISSWNVNSVRARIENIKEYLNKFAMNSNHVDFQINMLKSVKISDCIAKQRSIEGEISSAIDTKTDKYELKF